MTSHNPKQLSRGRLTPTVELVEVTPAIAEQWLSMFSVNRKSTGPTVDSYARQMERGEWLLTHQGIAFDDQGVMIDGEHRLRAIIKSGTTQPLFVFNGLDNNVKTVIDTGRARSTADVLRLITQNNDFNSRVVATLRIFSQAQGWVAKSARAANTELAEVYEAWADHILYGCDAVPHRRGFTSAVSAAFVSASAYGVDRVLLNKIAEVMKTGIPGDAVEANAVLLGNYLQSGGGYKKLQGTTRVNDGYTKTERMIESTLEGRAMKALTSKDRELFPLKTA